MLSCKFPCFILNSDCLIILFIELYYIEWSIKVRHQSIPLKFTGRPSESVTYSLISAMLNDETGQYKGLRGSNVTG